MRRFCLLMMLPFFLMCAACQTFSPNNTSTDCKTEGTCKSSPNDGGSEPKEQEPVVEEEATPPEPKPTDTSKTVGCKKDDDCLMTEYCQAGACYKLPPCKDGETRCGRYCTVLSDSEKHCGACGNACPTGKVCHAGACKTCTPGETTACGVSQGACTQGTKTCDVTGKWSGQCVGATLPTQETCNGLDDNCNGTIDDNVVDEGVACDHSTQKQGECAKGVQHCEQGAFACKPKQTSSKTEECNGLDDDCDGQIDNGRGGNSVCQTGCTFPFETTRPPTDPRSYSYTTTLQLDPTTGSHCPSRTLEVALRFDVSWDTYHGYRIVSFTRGKGWKDLATYSLLGKREKDFPYAHSSVYTKLQSPTGAIIEVVFDWTTTNFVKVHSIKRIQ